MRDRRHSESVGLFGKIPRQEDFIAGRQKSPDVSKIPFTVDGRQVQANEVQKYGCSDNGREPNRVAPHACQMLTLRALGALSHRYAAISPQLGVQGRPPLSLPSSSFFEASRQMKMPNAGLFQASYDLGFPSVLR